MSPDPQALATRRARALDLCRFLPGSFDKRFCRSVAQQTSPFTESQLRWIEYFAWAYRGQLPPDLVPGQKVARP